MFKKSNALCLATAFSLFFIFVSASPVLATSNEEEQKYNEKLIEYGLTEQEIVQMDVAMKEIIINDFESEFNNDQENSKLSYYQSEPVEYIATENRELVEVFPSVDFAPFSTIPKGDLKLFFSTANNGQRYQRIFAHFEWTKYETAPREYIGFSKETNVDIIPNSYEARIMHRQNTYNSWTYYSDAGGRPYKINQNHGATWSWNGGGAYYKGFVSYRVDTNNRRSGLFGMEYASQPTSANVTVGVNLGPFFIEHTSGSYPMMRAPHRASLIFNIGQ